MLKEGGWGWADFHMHRKERGSTQMSKDKVEFVLTIKSSNWPA